MEKSVFFAVFFATVFIGCAHAVAPLSQYGQIQNVQTYSTNPFYQKGIYNPKTPQPIYATGADLNTGDCARVVDSLVASECASRDNCRGLRVSDIRPNIMVKLSQLPGHNFATSCAGYIDGSFNTYTAKYGYNSTTTAFPAPTANTNNGFQIDNPFKQKPTAADARAAELAELQKQTQTTPHAVVGGDFPKTMADVSFTDRMAVAGEGYEPFKDMKSFRDIEVESEENFLARLKKINKEEYCRRVPSDCTAKTSTSSTNNNSDNNNSAPQGQCEPLGTIDCPIMLYLK